MTAAVALWYNTRGVPGLRRGQAMLEYVITLVALVVVVSILWGLVGVTLRYADRAEDLVTTDCP